VSLSPLVVACLAATWVIWGSTYLAIKFALESFPPFYQMGSRFLVAGLLLIAWQKLRGRTLPTVIEWRNAVIIGTLLLVSGMGFTAYAEQTVASGLVVAYIAIIPIIVTAMNLPFGLKPTRLELLGMLVGVAGVLMLVQGEAFTASRAGLLAITIACISWSLGSVLSQRKFPLAPGAMGFASEMLCGSVVLLLVVGLPRRLRLVAGLQRVHGAAVARQRRACFELHVREPRDRPRARHLARRRDRHGLRVGRSGCHHGRSRVAGRGPLPDRSCRLTPV
jgi:drug/metabolite transporter (DMT)-like permease